MLIVITNHNKDLVNVCVKFGCFSVKLNETSVQATIVSGSAVHFEFVMKVSIFLP